jgi:hypothetical protein
MLYEADRIEEAEEVFTGRITTVTEEGFPDLILPINLTAARAFLRGDMVAANHILLQAETTHPPRSPRSTQLYAGSERGSLS